MNIENGSLNSDITMLSSENTSDQASIRVDTNGETTIQTKDADALLAHLNLKADGDLILGASTGITKFYGPTYDTDDLCTLTVAADGVTTIATADADGVVGNLILDIDGNVEINADGGQVTIKDDTATHFAFDCNATRFRIYDDTNESDFFTIVVGAEGATTISTDDADTAVGHLNFDIDGHINLASGANFGAVGFTRRVSSFSDDTLSTGGTHDTTIDFRKGNKQYIDVTASMNDMNLIFPAITGNFVLIVRYDGNYDIDSWKVFESDESSADGSSNVMWQGGTEPTPTDSGRDVFSFLWDATEETCYGVASLDFQAGD